ncbi:MAG: hypothetical protein QME64_11935 [bacterium]|nr:hypothetical protein [bacterium]
MSIMKLYQAVVLLWCVIGWVGLAGADELLGTGTTYTSPSQVLDMGGKTRAGTERTAIDAIGQPGAGTAKGSIFSVDRGFLYTFKWSVNSYGQFSTSSDTTKWFYEKYGDGTAPGTLTRLASYGGQTGVIRITQAPGEKAKLTQVFSVSSPGWYIARANVATNVTTVSKQQKVYLYLQELASDTSVAATANQVIAPGSGGLPAAGSWKQLEIAHYTNSTILGIQVVGINPASSGITSAIYFDNLEVYREVPNGYLGTPVAIVNPSFASNTNSWGIEVYGDGTGPGTWSWVSSWSARNGIIRGNQLGGEKGKASQLCAVPAANKNCAASIWVYSAATSKSNTQKVYLYFYSFDSGYTKIMESGNGILQPGKWSQGSWQQLQFAYTPMSKYNAVQFVAINPPGKPTQSIYFDEVAIEQE